MLWTASLENKPHQTAGRVWPRCGLGEKFLFLYCWAKDQVCGPVCPSSSSWLSQCDLSLEKEWHGPSAEKEEPWCGQMWLKQNNIFSWGEQGQFLLPRNQVQVGHKGRKRWGKESANISVPECRCSASVSVFYLCLLPSLVPGGHLG